MKILIWSVHPKVGTGYGMGTYNMASVLLSLGHEVVIQSTYGNHLYVDNVLIEDATETPHSVTVYPSGAAKQYACDVIIPTIMREKPDIVMQFFDIFVIPPDLIKEINKHTRLISWLMIDAMPYHHQNLNTLLELKEVICTTNWSLTALPELDKIDQIKKHVCPLPISMYYTIGDTLGDMDIAREEFNNLLGQPVFNKDSFLVSVVSANIGDQFNRKNFWGIIRGWKKFIDIYGPENKYLYLHTDVRGQFSHGMDIKRDLAYANYSKNQLQTILFPDQIEYMQGNYSDIDLNNVYNSSDIYLNPSHGEGYGMPIAESCMAGCVPLVTNFGAGKEIVTQSVEDEAFREFCLLDGVPCYAGGHAERCLVGPEEIKNKLVWQYLNHYTKDKKTRLNIARNASLYQKEAEILDKIIGNK